MLVRCTYPPCIRMISVTTLVLKLPTFMSSFNTSSFKSKVDVFLYSNLIVIFLENSLFWEILELSGNKQLC